MWAHRLELVRFDLVIRYWNPLLTALAIPVVEIKGDPPQVHTGHASGTRVLAFE
jgi:hypothetical protein